MKKLYALILCALLAAAFPTAADAQAAEEAGFSYRLREDGTAVVTGYAGSEAQVDIPALLGGTPVAEIEEGAFRDNAGLSSVRIPEGVRSIGTAAFMWCAGLETAYFPESLQEIGNDAFAFCVKLNGISLPAGLASVGDRAFGACASLTEFDVDEGNPSLEARDGILIDVRVNVLAAYPSGRKDTHYDIPEGTAGIAPYAFSGTKHLEGVTIPGSMTVISAYAFRGSSLTGIGIPEGVARIAEGALSVCDRLLAVSIPASVTEINEGAFTGCNALTEICVQESSASFSSRDGVLYDREKKALLCYPGGKNNEWYDIPDGVETVGDSAFSQNGRLRKVTLPRNAMAIGRSAFYDCPRLEEVAIPATVTEIDPCAFSFSDKVTLRVAQGSAAHQYAIDNGIPWAFFENPAATAAQTAAPPPGPAQAGDFEFTLDAEGRAVLTKYRGGAAQLDIPGQLNGYPVGAIGPYAFSGVAGLDRVGVPEGVRTIGEHAFSSCGNLREVSLPESLAAIGEWAFSMDEKLSDAAIPSGVTSIGKGAFHWCRALAEIALPPGLTDIAVSAFAGCAVEALVVPEGVQGIGAEAFHSCNSLADVSIPASVASVGEGAFAYSHALSRFTLAEGNPAYESRDGVLFDKVRGMLHTFPAGRAASEYAVPPGTKAIARLAFSVCASLKRIALPDTVMSLGPYAFYGCGITQAEIPPGVTSIPDGLFAYCFDLEKVSVHACVTSIGTDAFVSCERLTLEVEDGSFAQQYAAANHISFTLASEAAGEDGYTPTTTAEAAATPAPAAEAADGDSPYAGAFFNAAYYARMNPDVAAVTGGDPGLLRAHWLRHGVLEGRRASPAFDPDFYQRSNADLAAGIGGDPAQAALHFAAGGLAEGRAGSALFCAADYLAMNPDLVDTVGSDPYALALHYNDQGFDEGRLASLYGLLTGMDTREISGAPFDASVFSGGTTLIHFWTSYCGPCVAQLPVFDALAGEYAGRLRFVGVLLDGLLPDLSAADPAAVGRALAFPGAGSAACPSILPTGALFALLKARGVAEVPAVWIVDRDGNILKQFMGPRDGEGWRREVAEALPSENAPLPEAAAGTPEPAQEGAGERAVLPLWPIESLPLHDLKAVEKPGERVMSYRGPGKHYRDAGAYRTEKMSKVKGLFIEGEHILAEMDYAGVGLRRLYFRNGAFKSTAGIPVKALEGCDALVAAAVVPRFGPGTEYDDFDGETLGEGTPLDVFFEENGWVFAQFETPKGLCRGWIEAERLR